MSDQPYLETAKQAYGNGEDRAAIAAALIAIAEQMKYDLADRLREGVSSSNTVPVDDSSSQREWAALLAENRTLRRRNDELLTDNRELLDDARAYADLKAEHERLRKLAKTGLVTTVIPTDDPDAFADLKAEGDEVPSHPDGGNGD